MPAPSPTKLQTTSIWGEAAHGQTYSELVQQQSEHLQGRHGAVDSHVGHGPIGRSEHGGLHRKGEVVQGEARGDTGLTPGRVWAYCRQLALSSLGQQANLGSAVTCVCPSTQIHTRAAPRSRHEQGSFDSSSYRGL